MRLKYDNVNENYLHDASQSESFEKPPFLSFRPNVLRIGRGPIPPLEKEGELEGPPFVKGDSGGIF